MTFFCRAIQFTFPQCERLNAAFGAENMIAFTQNRHFNRRKLAAQKNQSPFYFSFTQQDVYTFCAELRTKRQQM